MESVSTDEFVIAIHEHNDGVPPTVRHRIEVNVGQCGNVGTVLNVNIFRPIDPMECKVSSVCFLTPVGGTVVDDHRFVIAVILGEDRIEAVLYAKVSVIVEPRHHDAKGEFPLYLFEVVRGVEPTPIFLVGRDALLL